MPSFAETKAQLKPEVATARDVVTVVTETGGTVVTETDGPAADKRPRTQEGQSSPARVCLQRRPEMR